MNNENYSIGCARDLVVNINDLVVFMNSGALETSDELFNDLLSRLQSKVDSLSSCLTFVSSTPVINDN